MREVILTLAIVSLPALPAVLLGIGGRPEITPGPPPSTLRLSADAEAGRAAFRTSCAECHGALAQGAASGPALLHPAYGPDRYSDAEFRAAVREGRAARLWSFGPMPAHPDIPPEDLDRLIVFVRDLQLATGL